MAFNQLDCNTCKISREKMPVISISISSRNFFSNLLFPCQVNTIICSAYNESTVNACSIDKSIILDLAKLKPLADEKFNMASMVASVFCMGRKKKTL